LVSVEVRTAKVSMNFRVARREVKEECGIEIENVRFQLDIASVPSFTYQLPITDY
jgi:8-oxo-dGTP pyrophosphatase MutT (NUDIX family)